MKSDRSEKVEARAVSLDHSDIVYPQAIPFALVHLSCLAILWTGVSAWSLGLCLGLYLIRMFGVTAGYHRFFSHRSFRTSRLGQVALALLAQSSAQRGVLWWAAKHRDHHKHSDTPLDPHSPHLTGFWFSHVGWIFSRTKFKADLSRVSDLQKFPELVWLNKHQYVWPVSMGVVIWLLLGWEGLVVGYLLSTVLLFHGTFMINSLAHVAGTRRYVTGDHSRNNWLLAIITLGEGWHNNHHHFQSSARQGFRWYELDVTYYLLKVLAAVGLIWDLKSPPPEVVRDESRLRRVVVERVAHQIADCFSIERIAHEIRESWDHTHSLDEIREKAHRAYAHAQEMLSEVHLPQLPSLEDVKRAATEIYDAAPTKDQIVERARQIVAQRVSLQLFDYPHLVPA